MSECDSLTAIVADMRNDAEAYHDAWLNDPNESPESDAVSNVLANYARRIEAAWKREREAVGNAAAMRGACTKMRDLLMLRGDGKEYCILSWDEFNDSQKMLRAALSAPARNCDVMSRSICTKHFSTIYEGNRDGLCDVQTEREKNIHLYYIEFNKWLFAPAAERKGEY